MSKYLEQLSKAANTSLVATGGLEKQGITSPYRGLAIFKDGFSFPSVTAAKDIEQWNTAIAAGNIIPIGNGTWSDQSTEKTFFERPELKIKVVQTEKVKSLQFEYSVNACTRAELEKLEGKQGQVAIMTQNGILIARMNDDGTVSGQPLSSIDVDDIEPTEDSPAKTTTVLLTFSDPKGDTANPFQALIEWNVEDLDQNFAAVGIKSNESSNGSQLTFDVTLTEQLGNTNINGAVLADFKAEDVSGTALTIASVTPGANPNENRYTIVVTTAETSLYISFDGIRSIGGVNYIFSPMLITTA